MIGQDDLAAPANRALWLAAGALLRICRQVRGWDQEELARRAGVSLGMVAHAELGLLRDPAPDLWRRLTAGLGLKLAPFLAAAADRAGISPVLPTILIAEATGRDGAQLASADDTEGIDDAVASHWHE